MYENMPTFSQPWQQWNDLMKNDENRNIIDIDENLRLIGTAHVSSASVALVREQNIRITKPDIVAVELCESRLKSLKQPDEMDNEDLLNIVNEGRSS